MAVVNIGVNMSSWLNSLIQESNYSSGICSQAELLYHIKYVLSFSFNLFKLFVLIFLFMQHDYIPL